MTHMDFFQQQIELLEKLMPNGWFNNPNNNGHPAFEEWEFCKTLIAQGGVLKFPEQGTQLPMLARMILDSSILVTLTDGNLQKITIGNFEKFLKPVKKKILNSLQHPIRFDEVMLELSVASWHMMEKHKVEILEVNNYPDMKIVISSLQYPLYIECKNVTSENINYLSKNIEEKIKKANSQLEFVPEDHFGLVIFNVTKPIRLKKVNSDIYPDQIYKITNLIKDLLDDKDYLSIGASVVIWDDYMELGKPPEKTLIAYRKRFIRIDHASVPGCKIIVKEMDLFRGFTSTFSINWGGRN